MNSIRCAFAYEEGMDVEPAKQTVLKMESIELDMPYAPECVTNLERAQKGKIPLKRFP